jgi:hypothetical protein
LGAVIDIVRGSKIWALLLRKTLHSIHVGDPGKDAQITVGQLGLTGIATHLADSGSRWYPLLFSRLSLEWVCLPQLVRDPDQGKMFLTMDPPHRSVARGKREIPSTDCTNPSCKMSPQGVGLVSLITSQKAMVSILDHEEGTNMSTDSVRKSRGNDASHKLKECIFSSFFPQAVTASIRTPLMIKYRRYTPMRQNIDSHAASR